MEGNEAAATTQSVHWWQESVVIPMMTTILFLEESQDVVIVGVGIVDNFYKSNGFQNGCVGMFNPLLTVVCFDLALDFSETKLPPPETLL